MSKPKNDKRRARAKEKQQAKRRQQGQSPLARLAGEESVECWKDESDGIISLQVVRPVRGGGAVLAAFLIDLDCLGVKDAFLRLDMDMPGIRDMLRWQAQATGAAPVKVTPEHARELLAGGIRWTLAHPYFSLPPQTEKACKVLGGTLDIENADVREFGTEEGGLFYIGRRRDLERRLNGMTLEAFMEMDDVTCEFVEEEFAEVDQDLGIDTEEQDTLEEARHTLEQMQVNLKARMLDGARRWLFAHGQAPHPDLEKAVDLMMTASLQGLFAEGDQIDLDEEPSASPEGTDAALAAERLLLQMESPEERVRLAAAQEQLKQFMNSFKSQQEMLESLDVDLPQLPGDDEDE